VNLRINGRVALVTGASAGLSEAVALELAREGATLALAARRANLLNAVALKAEQAGAKSARGFVADFYDRDAVRRLVSDVERAYGKIDILVVNGEGPKPGSFLDMSIDDWDRAYNGKLRAPLELVYATVPAMRARGWGRVVALTSMTVREPSATLVLSNAYRTALISALKTLLIEVAPDGVTVNAIATGTFLTNRLLELYGGDEALLRTSVAGETSIKRVGRSEEFSPMVAFLSGEGAGYITGQTISVNGGFVKALF